MVASAKGCERKALVCQCSFLFSFPSQNAHLPAQVRPCQTRAMPAALPAARRGARRTRCWQVQRRAAQAQVCSLHQKLAPAMAQLLPFCLAASGQLYNFSLPCFSCDWCLWPGTRRGWAPAWWWREWSPQQWGLLAAGLGHPSVLCWHCCSRRSQASELWQRAHTERETKPTISILEVKWEIGHQVIRAIAVLPEANFPFLLCFQAGAGRALCVGVFCFFFFISTGYCSVLQDKTNAVTWEFLKLC